MKVLITGVNGFLARHLVYYLSNKTNCNIIATAKNGLKGNLPATVTYQNLDITNEQEVIDTIAFHLPQIIIHTAAMSKPDECEDDKEMALLTNSTAVVFLVKACLKNNIYLIFTSSDFIFGNDGEITDQTQPNPLNYYGQTKLWAEEIIKAQMLQYSIVRPVFMYGKQITDIRGCFLHWVLNNLKQGKEIKVVNDQPRKPTYVVDVCEIILQLLQEKKVGTFNICGDEVLTPYQMAVETATFFNLNEKLIVAVTQETFKEKAIRATNCIINNHKTKQALQFKPTSFIPEGLFKTFSE